MSNERSLVDRVGELVPAENQNGGQGTMLEVQSARAVAEVQGAMTIAKKFPRDENVAYAKIMRSCARKGLAEQAVYEYPRGGQKIVGPSIRLAEAIAAGWGNLDCGVIELERRPGESTAMSYCVDLESNYRKTVVFSVPHVRESNSGGKTNLTSSRDIYETIMNQGSRRLRNCIMAVVPGDIFDAALDKCQETLSKDVEPIQDRIRKMLVAMSEYGVTKEMIEEKLGHKIEATSEQQLAMLRRIFQSLKDGVGSVKEFFVDKKDVGAEIKNQVTGQAQPTAEPAQKKAEATPAKVASVIKPAVNPDGFSFSDAPSSIHGMDPHKIK